MIWGWFLLRIAIGLTILACLILSQRFWHRSIWRSAAKIRSTPLRVAVRLVWLAVLALIVLAFVDALRMGHRHILPRGTIFPAFVGLWFSSALFAYLGVKLIHGLERVWSSLRRAIHRRSSEKPSPASAPQLQPAPESAFETLANPSRRYFFQTATAVAGAAPFLGAMYGFAAERLNYQVRHVEVPVANLPPALDGLKIVQLSDIHLSGYMTSQSLRRAVGMANDLGADLAVVTGDFITGASDPLADCITELRELRAPLGIWGCNGNHEIYAKAENAAQQFFTQAGMKLLRQENARLTFNGSPFNLIGVDYQRERTPDGRKLPMLTRVEPLVRPDMPNILLSHNPNSFNRAAELGIELTLSGHTHGGQIQVEILDHRFSPARFITDYIAGLYHRPLFAPAGLEQQTMSAGGSSRQAPVTSHFSAPNAAIYVNRGLGTVGAPVRLGVPPEITLLVLRRA